MPNIATNYETACWMLREGIVENNPNKWGHLISKSHRDFNDYWTRSRKIYINYSYVYKMWFILDSMLGI